MVTEYYKTFYDKAQYTGISKFGNNLVHKSMLRLLEKVCFKNFLELGCGSHPLAEEDLFSNSNGICSDIRIPDSEILNHFKKPFIQLNIEKLPFKSNCFDAVFMNCLLVHLNNPVIALQELRRVTKPGGVILAVVPCDDGILLRLYQKLITNRKVASISGMNAKYINAIDHIVSTRRMLTLIKMIFESKHTKYYYPFKIFSINLNFFIIIKIS